MGVAKFLKTKSIELFGGHFASMCLGRSRFWWVDEVAVQEIDGLFEWIFGSNGGGGRRCLRVSKGSCWLLGGW